MSAGDRDARAVPAGGRSPRDGGAAHQEPLLVVRDVAIAYDRVPVLQRVSGQVLPGESVALIGPGVQGLGAHRPGPRGRPAAHLSELDAHGS